MSDDPIPRSQSSEFWQFMSGIKKVDPKFYLCMVNWLSSCESPGTTRQRQTHMVLYFRFFRRETFEHPSFSKTNPDILKAFFRMMKDKRRSDGRAYTSSYLKCMYSALKSFFQYAFIEGRIAENYMLKVKRPKGEDKIGYDILTDDETERFVNYFKSEIVKAKDSRPSVRRSAILQFTMVWAYLSVGMRSSELASIKLEDFLDSDFPQLRMRVKGNRIDTRPIPDSTADYIRQWIARYRRKAGPKDLVFCSIKKKDEVIPASQIKGWIAKACKKIGIKKRVTTHSLRATMLTRIYRQGANIFEVQAAAGHKETQTTFGYIRLAEMQQNSAARRYDLENFLSEKKPAEKRKRKPEVIPTTLGQ